MSPHLTPAEQFLSLETLELCTTILSNHIEEASSLVLRQAEYQISQIVDDAVNILFILRDVSPQIHHRLIPTLSGPLFVLRCIYHLLNGDLDPSASLDFWNENDREVALNSLVQEMRSWMLDPDLCVRCVNGKKVTLVGIDNLS